MSKSKTANDGSSFGKRPTFSTYSATICSNPFKNIIKVLVLFQYLIVDVNFKTDHIELDVIGIHLNSAVSNTRRWVMRVHYVQQRAEN